MKFSSKIEKSSLSPMRKFHPYAVAAEAKGRKIYHLNIGQPDIETPQAFFDAVRDFDQPVLAYAPSAACRDLSRRSAVTTEILESNSTAETFLRQPAAAKRSPSPSPAFWTRETRSDPGAFLSQLQHVCEYDRRRHPSDSDHTGRRVLLRRSREDRAADQCPYPRNYDHEPRKSDRFRSGTR